MKEKCPKCKKNTYVVSVFGSICSNEDCFYVPVQDKQKAPMTYQERGWDCMTTDTPEYCADCKCPIGKNSFGCNCFCHPIPYHLVDHRHCWDQEQPPACGIKGEHKICCLCAVTHEAAPSTAVTASRVVFFPPAEADLGSIHQE